MGECRNAALERTLRASYGRALGALVRIIGDLDTAEDALQNAAERAATAWQQEWPDNPAAWLIRAARNQFIDQTRRTRMHAHTIALMRPLVENVTEHVETDAINDGFLGLILVCCHPALAPKAQLVLTLRIVLGFDVLVIARALLVSESTIKKRLVRAKTKIRDAGIPYEVPPAEGLGPRLETVCDVVYLMFNEGYSRPLAETSVNLCHEALRLTRLLASQLRDNRNIRSLLALMLFGIARLPGRYDRNGAYVPLDLQDRSLWDWDAIREGLGTLDSVFQRRLPPTSYQLQAAISACHCRHGDAAETDWTEIAALYGRLERLEPTPVVKVNRAVALIHSGETEAGLGILAALETTGTAEAYQPFHAAQGFALEHAGQMTAAADAYRRAVELTEPGPENQFLERKWRKLAGQN